MLETRLKKSLHGCLHFITLGSKKPFQNPLETFKDVYKHAFLNFRKVLLFEETTLTGVRECDWRMSRERCQGTKLLREMQSGSEENQAGEEGITDR